MNYIEDFHELSDAALRAKELSDELYKKITICLDDLGQFLKDDLERPAIVEDYENLT